MISRVFTKNILFKLVTFVASAVLLLTFLPQEDENHFTYETNRPWSYPLLTAPFDIPIHLDSIKAQAVKDSIDRNFQPVYYRDLTTEKTSISAYASRLNNATAINLTPLERNALLNEIKKIYDNGIVDQSTYSHIADGALPKVRMIHDNVAISIPTTNYTSARTAYTQLDSLFRDVRFQEAIRITKLSELLEPNILLDSIETERLRNEMYKRAMAPIGVIQQGERIVDRGDIVTPQLYTILRTYEELSSDRPGAGGQTEYSPTIGLLLYIVLLLATLYTFLYFFRRDYYDRPRILAFIVIMVTAFALFAFGMSRAFSSGLYLTPFTIIPIIILVFLDSRTAFFSYLITILLSALVARFQLEFVFLQFVAGIAATVSIRELSKRSHLIRTAAIVFMAYSLAYVAIELIHTGTADKMTPQMFGNFAINAVFISFAYVLVFILEKLFGFTSRVTLVELSDINTPLMRELSEECPGTFQHSMAVSNLASAAAHRIGANVQLVRAGALYHDIGKISNPAFFTENQHGVNPHDALDPMQSARIVISHVAEGLRRAEKAKLPEKIRRFISEHHGKGKARYFYNTYCNAHPGEEVDPAPFTYPGPNPSSRETSILMMADSVEAASRSMSDHSPEAIAALVNKIIDSQIADGLHNDSPISFRDVKEIKDVFASRLRTMYHSRISYPELVKPANDGTGE